MNGFRLFPLFHFLIFVAFSLGVGASVPEVDPEELPRIPPTEPADALETFEIKDGFKIELRIAEPLVIDPVAISFDENGQLYVIEMIDYSERRDETLGKVILLRDTDGDGFYDERTVFAEGLGWPTAIICYDGGVFVAASPDIIWLKDRDGDGRADERKTVFTGFGSHMERLNVQALLNNLTWGLDNRIHGATSGNGGTVRSLLYPDEPAIELRARDFSFDPRTLKLRAEAGGGQHGMSFDNRGQKIVSSNSRHLQALMYDERYAGKNPFLSLPRNLIDIPVDGPAAEVYRISPDEPWRIMRTKWRVEGIVSGIIEGGGRVSGYFTGASGGTIYRGDALPPEFLGNAFVGDVGGNLIHRKEIRYDGVEPVAERPEDEQEIEFLASTDIWFRPVDFENAPDGSLYVLDMYREVIEHPWSLPDEIKKHLDLNSGNDRGRIYRIVPETFEEPPPARLGEMTIAELVETLAHSNGWHRDTAARLLYEKQNREAVPLLENLLKNSDQPLGRLHAIYALDGLDALETKHLLVAFDDPDDRVRQHAVKSAEKLLTKMNGDLENLAENLIILSSDSSPFVRYQLAFTLGELAHPGRAIALAEIVKNDFKDRWIRAAVLNSATDVAGELFSILAVEKIDEQEFRSFLAQLIGLIAAKNEQTEVAAVVKFLANQPAEISFDLIRTFSEGLYRAGSSIVEAAGIDAFEAIVDKAVLTAQNRKIPVAVRSDAIRVLSINQVSKSGPLFLSLLNTEEVDEIQLAAIQALDQLNETDQLAKVLDDWDRFTPRIRSEILTVFLKRPERSVVLLQAIKDKSVARSDLSSTQIDFLREQEQKEISQLTEDLFPKERNENRAKAIERFQVSLGLTGDTNRGADHFRTLCASCHRDGTVGYALGPDLTSLKSAGKESLLANIIDPNAEVAPAYLAYLVETKDGQSHFGLIVDETPQNVILRQAFGQEQTILRSEIVRIQSQGRSMMPEGLEGALDTQGMADLLEYIMSD